MDCGLKASPPPQSSTLCVPPARHPGRDRSQFLEIIARGARLQTGAFVRTTDCEPALADLEQAGLIESVPDNG
jgi:hypothetical protein